jgi:hypothetical protein
MPILRNARHEKFAREFAKNDNAAQAYILAGFKPKGAAQNASRLIKLDNVRRRIEELQSTAAEKVGVTLQWWIAELIWNATIARRVRSSKDRILCAKVAAPYLEMLGRHIGAFAADSAPVNPANAAAPVVNVGVGVGVQANITATSTAGAAVSVAECTDEQLRAMLAAPAVAQAPTPTTTLTVPK